jgi:uncharacterized protein YukE
MTTFDLAQYEITLHRIDAGLDDLSRIVRQLPAATASITGRWYMTDAMSASIAQVSATLTSIGHDLIAKLKELLRGAIAPIRFFALAGDWGGVRGLASSIAGELQPVALSVDFCWQGRAADAYQKVIPAQVSAAVRIGAMADKTQTALTWSAAAGCAFYLGVLVVVIQLIIAFIGVLAALESVVFSWAALALAIEKATFSAAEIVALVGLLAAALTTQEIQLSNLHSEAEDAAAFPHHQWPSSVTDRYTDATVTDGDAEWSVEQR